MRLETDASQLRRCSGDLGVVHFVRHLVAFASGNAPFGKFIGPFGQDACGLFDRGLVAGLNVNEPHLNRVAGSVADILNRRAPAGFHAPGLSPLCHRENDLAKFLSGFGRRIFVSWRVGLVRSPGHQSFIRQFVEPVGQDVRCDAQRLYQFIKSAQAQQQIPKHKYAPAISENGQRRRNGALSGFVSAGGAFFCQRSQALAPR